MFRHENIVIGECNKPIRNKDGMDHINRSSEAVVTQNIYRGKELSLGLL